MTACILELIVTFSVWPGFKPASLSLSLDAITSSVEVIMVQAKTPFLISCKLVGLVYCSVQCKIGRQDFSKTILRSISTFLRSWLCTDKNFPN